MFYIPLATKHRCTGRSLASPLTKQAPDPQTRMTSMRQRVTPVLSRLCCTYAIFAAVVAQATVASSQGLTFTKPNIDSFRDKLRAAGFYKEWREKVGADGWALLEKHVGKLA